MLLALAAATRVLLPRAPAPAETAGLPVLQAVRERPLHRVALVVVVLMLGHFTLWTYVSPLLLEAGVSPTGVGLVLLGVLSGDGGSAVVTALTVAAVVAWGAAFVTLPTLLQTLALSASPASEDAAPAVVNAASNVGIAGGALVGAQVLLLAEPSVLAVGRGRRGRRGRAGAPAAAQARPGAPVGSDHPTTRPRTTRGGVPLTLFAASLVLAGRPAGAAPADLDGVAGWAVGVMEALGAPGAGFVVLLENLFPPIPSEVILPLAGFTAAQGSFSLLSAILWTTAGSVAGALLLYELGRVVGRDRVKHLAGKLPLVDTRDIDVAERWFIRHGPKAVFFGRMLPIIRSAISVPAGVEKMPVWQFLLYTLAGSAIWNTIFIVAGYQLGERYTEVEQYAEILQQVVIAVVVLLVAWFVVSRVVRRQRAHPDVAVPPDEG